MTIHMQDIKVAKMLAPISGNATAYTTTSVDTQGFHYATILFGLGVIGADMDSVKIQGSDDDSSYADITGATWTAPTTASDAGTARLGFIDLRKAGKRYIKAVIDPGAAATLACMYALLSRSEQAPDTATERGVAAQFIV